MIEVNDAAPKNPCEHLKDRTITYSTNKHSGSGSPPEREITHCYECGQTINVIDHT